MVVSSARKSTAAMILPGLRKRHLLILGLCAYTLQAIATADGPFKLNHSLVFATKENGEAGIARTLAWMDKSSDAIDTWSIERFGKDPWMTQGEFLSQYTKDCVTTPSRNGYLSPAKISLYHNSKKRSLQQLGSPLCKTTAGSLRYITGDPSRVFEVNPKDLNDYGAVKFDH
jgi:hypothetical protein